MKTWPWAVVITAIFLSSAYFLFLSWGKWPDLFIDSGRELYIPWQLSEGRVLYRDIAFYYGPLSKYFHALLFKVFSPGFWVIVISNLFILGVLAWLIYRSLRLFASASASLLSLGMFLALFAFGQYLGIGNYNYAFAYAHEAVHGLVLCFGAFFLLGRYLQRPSGAVAGSLGLVMGLVFLTKVEVSLAMFVAAAAAVLWVVITDRPRFSVFLKRPHGLILAGCFFAPIFLFWVYFSWAMGAWTAVKALLFQYSVLFHYEIGSKNFYMSMSGWDLPGRSFLLMGRTLAAYVLVLGVCFGFAWLTARVRDHRVRAVTGVLLGGFFLIGCYVAVRYYVPAFEIFRPLFVTALAGAVLAFLRREFFLFVFSVFSTALMAKLMLFGHIHHYGFVLAVPAVLLLLVFIIDRFIPFSVTRGADHAMAAALVGAVLLAVVCSYGYSSFYYYHSKTYPVGNGADRFFTYLPEVSLKGVEFVAAVDVLKSFASHKSVAVFPEGVMLNYLARRVNPTRYFEFAPGFFQIVPEQKVLRDLEQNPPDYIVLMERDMSEHGARYFGVDYARSFAQWMARGYVPAKKIGAVPFSGQGFGILICRRKG